MGYTSYWGQKERTITYSDGVEKAVHEIRVLKELMPEYCITAGNCFPENKVIIRGGDGKGSPYIDTDEIWFNGDSRTRMDYETFHHNFKDPEDFSFCKTARKPYDQFVCLCLLSMANHIEGFEFSSDGDEDDWEDIVLFYLQKINHLSHNLADSLRKIGFEVSFVWGNIKLYRGDVLLYEKINFAEPVTNS